MESNAAEPNRASSPLKNLAMRINHVFESENPRSEKVNAGVGNPEQGTASAPLSSGPSKPARSLPSSSQKPNPVRDALDAAAVKLSSVGTTLEQISPAPGAARRNLGAQWDLSTDNPVFAEAITPRGTFPKSQESTPRSARTPGSTQKEEANHFPRSYPVPKPAAAPNGGGISGWMRRNRALDAQLADAASRSPFDDEDEGSGKGAWIVTMLLLLVVIFIIAGASLLPIYSSSVAGFPARVQKAIPPHWVQAVQQSQIYRQISTWVELAALQPQQEKRNRMLLPPKPRVSTSASKQTVNLPALVKPRSPQMTPARFGFSDLRQAMVAVFKEAPMKLQTFSSKNALQELTTARQKITHAVKTPAKLLGAAVGGVGLAAVLVAGLLKLHGAAPLSALSLYASGPRGEGDSPEVLGFENDLYAAREIQEGLEEEKGEEAPASVRRSGGGKTPARKSSASRGGGEASARRTPARRSSRRAVGSDAE